MMNIVILDGYTANPGDLSWDRLKTFGELTVYERTPASDTVERAKDADIVLTNKVILGKAEIEQLPRLKYIGVLATGYNVVDMKVAREHGIDVCNIPAYSTNSVAQMVFAHILNVASQVEHYAQANRQGAWTQSIDFSWQDTQLTELEGKTLGIVGLGNIGKAVARIGQAFGMKILAETSKSQDALPDYIEKVDRNTLFERADFLTLHCPLTDSTRNLVCKESIARMKPTSVVINTGRGPLVNEADMAEALLTNKIYAYCADVLCSEPPAANNPLLACTNAYITPHIAWATREARARLVDIAIKNVQCFVEGQVQNVVN
jgi:glycerate dehydrogenase